MLDQATIGDRILEVVKANPGCTFEEIIVQFTDLHWWDVYLEVDRLRRLGRLRMIHDGVRLTSFLRLL